MMTPKVPSCCKLYWIPNTYISILCRNYFVTFARSLQVINIVFSDSSASNICLTYGSIICRLVIIACPRDIIWRIIVGPWL